MDRAFYARIGAVALSAAMLTAPMASKARNNIPTENLPGTIYDMEGNILKAPSKDQDLVITFEPEAPTPEAPTPETDTPKAETTTEMPTGPTRPWGPSGTVSISIPEEEASPAKTKAKAAAPKPWDGNTTLDSYNGHIDGPTGDETYYNLPMHNIVDRMHRMGIEGEYWVREDGVKMLGNFVMVAANLSVHPRGSIVETSLGTGIVCDTGDFAKKHPNRLDIATNW